jgi:rubrerythrin
LIGISGREIFNIKGDPSEKITEGHSINEILTLGLQMEKDAILFYDGIKGLTLNQDSADVLEKIIKQEKGHVLLLKQRINDLV